MWLINVVNKIYFKLFHKVNFYRSIFFYLVYHFSSRHIVYLIEFHLSSSPNLDIFTCSSVKT